MQNNFFAFKLNKINELKETKERYELSFSIDSFIGKYNNHDIKLFLNKKDLSINIEHDKSLNNLFKQFINKSIQDYRYIEFKKINFFNKDINKSDLTYIMLDKEFNAVMDWEYIQELNQIEIPYSNGHKMSSFMDINYLELVFSQYFLNQNLALKQTNQSIALISLSMYLESIIQNRIMNVFLYAQSLYLLNIMALENAFNLFEKINKDYELKINDKLIKFNISTQLDNKSLLNLEIIARIKEKTFILTDSNHNLNLNSLIELMSEIYGEKINLVKTKKNSSSLREIKNEFVIINNVEKKMAGIVYEPLNSILTECKGFVFDIHKMEIEEIFSISELNNLVFEKIKQMLI